MKLERVQEPTDKYAVANQQRYSFPEIGVVGREPKDLHSEEVTSYEESQEQDYLHHYILTSAHPSSDRIMSEIPCFLQIFVHDVRASKVIFSRSG